MKAKELILSILSRKPNILTFHLAKLCYLFDLAYAQITGNVFSGLPYIWDYYGPYCKEFVDICTQLEAEGKILVDSRVARNGHSYRLYSPTGRDRTIKLSPVEQKVLNFVISRYASLSVEKLKEYVYSTPPMIKAQAEGLRGVMLDMNERNSPSSRYYNREYLSELMMAYETPESEYIPLESVIEELDSIPSSHG